jgi:hypothetical protein
MVFSLFILPYLLFGGRFSYFGNKTAVARKRSRRNNSDRLNLCDRFGCFNYQETSARLIFKSTFTGAIRVPAPVFLSNVILTLF